MTDYEESYEHTGVIRHATCPRCQERFAVLDYEAGMTVLCPSCGRDIRQAQRIEDDPERGEVA